MAPFFLSHIGRIGGSSSGNSKRNGNSNASVSKRNIECSSSNGISNYGKRKKKGNKNARFSKRNSKCKSSNDYSNYGNSNASFSKRNSNSQPRGSKSSNSYDSDPNNSNLGNFGHSSLLSKDNLRNLRESKKNLCGSKFCNGHLSRGYKIPSRIVKFRVSRLYRFRVICSLRPLCRLGCRICGLKDPGAVNGLGIVFKRLGRLDGISWLNGICKLGGFDGISWLNRICKLGRIGRMKGLGRLGRLGSISIFGRLNNRLHYCLVRTEHSLWVGTIIFQCRSVFETVKQPNHSSEGHWLLRQKLGAEGSRTLRGCYGLQFRLSNRLSNHLSQMEVDCFKNTGAGP